MARARKGTKKKDRPYVPTPDDDAVKRGAPSGRTKYLKDGVPLYKHKDGSNRVRFLAWKDGAHFFYYLFIHQGVGYNDDTFACLQKNWNEECPLCKEGRKQLDEDVEWDEVLEQGLLPKKHPRILAQIVDRKEEEKGVQIWNVTAFEIDDTFRSLSIHPDTGAVIPWTDPENGYDLIYEFNAKDQRAYPKALQRSDPKPLDVAHYEGVMDFDDLIYKPSPEEMEESFFGSDPEEVDNEPDEPTEEEQVEQTGEDKEPDDDDYDPLEGADCCEKAYGFYDICSDDDCPDFKACKDSQNWTGDECPSCELPLYETKDGVGCYRAFFVKDSDCEVKAKPKGEKKKRRRRRAS